MISECVPIEVSLRFSELVSQFAHLLDSKAVGGIVFARLPDFILQAKPLG
jgi:hypothetical protein